MSQVKIAFATALLLVAGVGYADENDAIRALSQGQNKQAVAVFFKADQEKGTVDFYEVYEVPQDVADFKAGRLNSEEMKAAAEKWIAEVPSKGKKITTMPLAKTQTESDIAALANNQRSDSDAACGWWGGRGWRWGGCGWRGGWGGCGWGGGGCGNWWGGGVRYSYSVGWNSGWGCGGATGWSNNTFWGGGCGGGGCGGGVSAGWFQM